ncbi:MAG: hypothetical protein V1738_01010 [Patescibacteria group bacterium]
MALRRLRSRTEKDVRRRLNDANCIGRQHNDSTSLIGLTSYLTRIIAFRQGSNLFTERKNG